jgi:hypothetical protein
MSSAARGILIGMVSGLALITSANATVVIYQTSFEPSEGYDTNADLVGQKGWLGAGSGGNGLVSGYFPGPGFQAYVGFTPPATNDSSLFLYQPVKKNLPQVQFSATMAIIDSKNTNWDDFYWSVFNQQGQPLFTLDFDNFELKLYYYLDNTNGRTWSGLSFTNGVAYPLTLAMDFASNRWNATFNGLPVATNQPITTVGSSLTLGDIDAAWAVYDPNAPGNNFMVFDDYRITANVPAPQVAMLGKVNGSPTLRVTGLADNSYSLEASTNLFTWFPLQTNLATGGRFDYVDDGAPGVARRFYRARWVP